MAELTDLRLAVGAARLARERALLAMRSAETHANFWRVEDGSFKIVDANLNREIAAEIAGLQPALDAAGAALADAQATFDRVVREYDTAAAQAPLFAADNGLPLLLLPVRIEAVYRTGDAGPQLCIRVYPDDIHVDTHDPALTTAERQAGERYWRHVWAAGPDRARRSVAWGDLVTAVGGTRARWVREALTPRGEPPAQATPLDAPAPDPGPFPDVPIRKETWTRGARTALLPDHFAFSAYRDGALVWRHDGAPIPDTLPVGFAPPDDEEAGPPDGLPWDEQSRWLADFDAAVRVGMGLVVPLSAADESFDLLTVVGVGTQDAATGAERVRSALAAHAYVNGLSSLQPGTPTNNTPASRSGWHSRGTPTDPDEVAARRSAYEPAGDQDAPRLARALGIDGADVLAACCDSGAGAETTLAALHRLEASYYRFSRIWFPPSDGTQVKPPEGLDFLADHFTRFVRGRGPLPLLRVGRQPYGVLPVSALYLWRGDDVDARIVEHVTSFAAALSGYVSRAAQVGAGADQDAVLLDLLSREAAPRRLGEHGASHNPLERPPAAVVGSVPPTSLLALLKWFATDHVTTYAPFPDEVSEELAAALRSKPVATLLAGADEYSAVLAADAAQGDHSVLFDRVNPVQELLRQLWAFTPHSTFYAQAWWAQNALWNGLVYRGSYMKGEYPEATPEYIEKLKAEAPMWRALLAEYAALEEVAVSDLAGWERLLREVLDTLSHRVDAWVTSLPTARLAAIRATSARGLRTGAYGWLTDVNPGDAAPHREGFVLTPSLHHATTAAVLRSGWQAHSDRRAFAVDVQSTRVRRALSLLDGVRGGQPVAALLGYQLERALHDARLDRFVAGFRRTYPLAALVEPEGVGSQEARVAIGARNVIDGQAIRRDRSRLLDDTALAQAAGTDLGGDAAAVRRMIADLDETLDAAADLLLAESVHHLVGGNPLRTGLAADAAGRGQDLPAEFDVVRTPRSGSAVTHHVGVLLPQGGAAGWSTARPLADLEPALEAWAQRRLGPATDWSFECVTREGAPADPVRLADLGWCALDVLVAPDGRLLDTLLAEAGAPVRFAEAGGVRFGELCQLRGRLRAVVASATPLTPTHLDPADPCPGTGYAVTELATRVRPWADALLSARAELVRAHESADEAAVRRALTRLTDLGVPAAGDGNVASAAERVLDVLAGLTATEPPPDADADPCGAESWVNRTLAMAGQVLPPTIKVMPRLRRPLPNPPASGAEPDDVAAWVRDMALVRAHVDALDTALVAAAVLTDAELPAYVVAQPPEPGTGAPAPWLANAAATATPDRPRCTLVLHREPDAAADPLAGLVVDSWTEVIPTAAAGECPEEIAGVAFDYDRPGARAPQTMLLAVPPDPDRGWCLEDVHGCVEETLLLARMRALDLVDVPELRNVLPIPNGEG